MRNRLLLAVVLITATVLSLPALAGGEPSIPAGASLYRRDLVRNAHLVWGLDAPIATFASQIHQESGWRPDARSPYAHGLAQFTPATAEWIGALDPVLAGADTGNPQWALRALVRYDRHLWGRTAAASPCDRMAFVLAAYNGGEGWVWRDRRAAGAAGADADRWWGEVERFNAGRAAWAFTENRGYPARILKTLEPLYRRAGWGGGMCS